MKNLSFNNLAAILLLFLLIGCGGLNSNKPVEVTNISIDTKMRMLSPDEMDSCFVDRQYLTFKGAMISEITRLILWDNHYVVFDKREKQVLLFDMDGNCTAKIKRVGRGPGEYVQLCDIAVDESNDELVLHCDSPSKFIRYDKEGKFISERTLPSYFHNIIFDKDAVIYGYNPGEGGTYTKPGYSISKIILDSKDVEITEMTPMFVEAPNISSSSVFLVDCGQNLWFSKPFDYNIYTLDSESGEFLPRYQFEFGSQSLPNGYVSKDLSVNDLLNSDYVYHITNVGVIGNYLMFNCSYRTFIMNLKTNEVKMLGMLKVLDDNNIGVGAGRILENQSKVGFAIVPHSLLENANNREDNPEKFKDLLDENKEWGNPVIMFYTLK